LFATVARLRSFQSPRLSVVLLIVGLSCQALARNRMATVSARNSLAVASLDSAIAAASPATEDTSVASNDRLRGFVSRRRDAEVEARRASEPWFYGFLLSGGVVAAAVVTGALGLLEHVRGEPKQKRVCEPRD
jgi:hypothetical protein